jgi:eukaryotic-like serine/threonine-protein kinase
MRRLVLAGFLFLLTGCGANPKILWTTSTEGPIYASPALNTDLVFIGSQDQNFYALNQNDGSIRWKRNLQSKIVSTPLVHNGSIYIGSGDGSFFSLDPATGTTKWTFKSDGLIDYDTCTDESGMYFGNHKGSFYKLDYSGNVLWTFQTTNKFEGRCILYKDLVFTSSWDSNFYGLNKNTGTVIWKVSSGILNFAGPEVVGDTVYFASHNKIYCIDANTGKLRSTIKTTYLNHVVYAKNYLWTNEKGLTKRSLDGNVLGSVEFHSSTDFRPLFNDNIFILAGDSSKLFGVSQDLKILWNVQGGEAFWSPGVVKNNVYYTGNRDNKVYAIQLPKT